MTLPLKPPSTNKDLYDEEYSAFHAYRKPKQTYEIDEL